MKKSIFLLTVIIITITATGWCNDKSIFSASAVAVDSIIAYYSSMAKLENADPAAMGDHNYAAMYDYMQKNKARLITAVSETKSAKNLIHAAQIVNSLYLNQGSYHAYGRTDLRATAQGYFDSATGHRYYKTGPETYAEYSKKGNFLKTISSDQPLLTTRRNVHPITEDNYILYRRSIQGKMGYLALPGYEQHPKGWKADRALISLK